LRTSEEANFSCLFYKNSMGTVCSKQKKKGGISEDDAFVYDPRLIYYDDDGNLRYDEGGKIVSVDKELKEIMSTDDLTEEDDKTWCVIETAWLSAWLTYTRLDKGVSPRPGICRNDRLIIWNEEENKYVVRNGLTMASKTWKGDYRRVSLKTWEKFQELYPGSGPTITMEYTPAKGKKGEEIKNWIVVNPPLLPDEDKRKKLEMKFWRKKQTEEVVDTSKALGDTNEDKIDDVKKAIDNVKLEGEVAVVMTQRESVPSEGDDRDAGNSLSEMPLLTDSSRNTDGSDSPGRPSVTTRLENRKSISSKSAFLGLRSSNEPKTPTGLLPSSGYSPVQSSGRTLSRRASTDDDQTSLLAGEGNK